LRPRLAPAARNVHSDPASLSVFGCKYLKTVGYSVVRFSSHIVQAAIGFTTLIPGGQPIPETKACHRTYAQHLNHWGTAEGVNPLGPLEIL